MTAIILELKLIQLLNSLSSFLCQPSFSMIASMFRFSRISISFFLLLQLNFKSCPTICVSILMPRPFILTIFFTYSCLSRICTKPCLGHSLQMQSLYSELLMISVTLFSIMSRLLGGALKTNGRVAIYYSSISSSLLFFPLFLLPLPLRA